MQRTLNGAAYRLREWGAGAPLLLLHGFSGSGADWQPLAAALGDSRRVIAPDLLGHGESAAPAAAARYAIERAAADVLALLDALSIPQVDLLGYSMGGRLALYIACRHPARCRSLYLESSSPGIADTAARAARAAQDAALANWIEEQGIAAFVARWEQLPLWASQAGLPPTVAAAQRARRLRNRPVGLANSLRGMGTGSQPSLWSELPGTQLPTRLIAGALDAKFATLAKAMTQLMPQAALHIQPGAGHNLHLEQPSFFAADAARWLADPPAM